MDRTKLILGKLDRRLRSLKVDPFPRPDELLVLLNEVELDVAQRGLAIKTDFQLLMDAGEEIYELGVRLFRIRKLIVPQSWRTPVEIFTNEEQWDRFLHKKSLFQVTSQPVGAFVWAGRMRFYPAPLITGEEIQILGYLLPSRVIDEGVDPEVDLTWDRCLEYGVMDQLIGGDWHTRYEDELGKQQQQNLREILAPHTIDNFSSDLGF